MFDRRISIVVRLVRSISETSDVAMIFYAVSEFYYYAFISRLTTDKGEVKRNSRKSVRWSAVPVPCLSRLWMKLRGSRAAAPKGSMTYAFTHMGDFLLLLLLLLLLRPSPLKSQSRGPNSSLEA